MAGEEGRRGEGQCSGKVLGGRCGRKARLAGEGSVQRQQSASKPCHQEDPWQNQVLTELSNKPIQNLQR